MNTTQITGDFSHPDTSALRALQSIRSLVDDILDHAITSEFALSTVEQFTKDAKEWLSTGATTSVSDAILVPPTWGRA